MKSRILKVLPVLVLCMLFVLVPERETKATTVPGKQVPSITDGAKAGSRDTVTASTNETAISATLAPTVMPAPAGPIWINNCNFGWLNPDPTFVYIDCYGHTGEYNDPYVIKDEKDLAALSYFSNVMNYDFIGKYISFQSASGVLDMSAFEWTPIGSQSTFYGTLYGNGVVIDNLQLGTLGTGQTYPTSGFIGIFKGEAYKIFIKNFKIVNTPYEGNSAYIGGFAAIDNGWIYDCEVQGYMLVRNVPIKKVGGFIGQGRNQQALDHCLADFDMEFYNVNHSPAYVGGFAGDCDNTVKYCNAYLKLTMEDCNMNSIGGFIGYGYSNLDVYSGMCYPNMKIHNNNDILYIGGFVGCGKGQYYGSSSTGFIDAMNNIFVEEIGGFVGFSDGATYKKCKDKMDIYAVANPSKTIGGFAGYVDSSIMDKCSYSGPAIKADKVDYMGGFLGSACNTTVTNSNVSNTTIIFVNGSGNLDACAGGFAGSTDGGKTIACYFNGKIEADSCMNVGGFTANCYHSTADSCYAVGDIYAGNDSNVGGFFGKSESATVCASYASCNLEVQNNCYAGGAIGYAVNTNNIATLYWNKDKTQRICGSVLPAMYNKAVGNGVYIGNIIGWSDSLMRSNVFVATLNGSLGSITNWSINPSVNGGYPVF